MTTPHSIRTALLDTNTLLRLFDFWKACQLCGVTLDLITSVEELRSAWAATGATIANSIESEHLREVNSGMACFSQLSAAKARYEFFTCRVCRLEMHRTIMNVYAMEGMIKAGVPFSIRLKRPLLVYRRGLQNSDYEAINHELETFFETMRQDHGIDIKTLEDTGHGGSVPAEEIFDNAEVVGSRILLDTMDAYVYGAAIACRADCLLTLDFSLRQTAIQLNNPSGEWDPVVRDLHKVLGSPAAYRLPIGHDPTKRLT